MNGVLSPGNFASSPSDSKFHPELNDAISSLQSFYSRHRRFSMNRTVLVRETTRHRDARALFPQKSQKFLCLVFTLPRAWIRTKPPLFFSLFFTSFFRVVRSFTRARLCREIRHVPLLRFTVPKSGSGWKFRHRLIVEPLNRENFYPRTIKSP